MAITYGPWFELLRPTLARTYFEQYFRRRRPYERRRRYEAEREDAFRDWIAKLPAPEDYYI